LTELSPWSPNFKNKTVVVTGATGHLGTAMASAFAELGAKLVLIDLDEDSLSELASSLAKSYDLKTSIYSCDFSDPESRRNQISNIARDIEVVDVLVNNAAFVGSSKLSNWSVPFEQQSSRIWPDVMEVNLTSIFDFTQGLQANLIRAKEPSIVNIASLHAHVGPDWDLYSGTNMSSPAAYAASKAALLNLTKWLSVTIAPNVRVNSVSPGGIFRNQPNTFVSNYLAKTPLNRMAKEKDVVGAVLFLASSLSSYITGQDIRVDGGYGTA
jgi:NAD(P)-dependent dehydrogenase (short-subunit alcohol dehydrogenase family)